MTGLFFGCTPFALLPFELVTDPAACVVHAVVLEIPRSAYTALVAVAAIHVAIYGPSCASSAVYLLHKKFLIFNLHEEWMVTPQDSVRYVV